MRCVSVVVSPQKVSQRQMSDPADSDENEPITYDQCDQKLAECQRLLVSTERLNDVLDAEAKATIEWTDSPDVVPLHSPADGSTSAGKLALAARHSIEAQCLLRTVLSDITADGDAPATDDTFDIEFGETMLKQQLHSTKCFLDDLRAMSKLKRYRNRIDADLLKQLGFRLAILKSAVAAREAAILEHDKAASPRSEGSSSSSDSVDMQFQDMLDESFADSTSLSQSLPSRSLKNLDTESKDQVETESWADVRFQRHNALAPAFAYLRLQLVSLTQHPVHN